MNSDYPSLDDLDRKILREISADGRITVTDLAKRIGLSKTPCQLRLRRLEDSGVITGYRALLNAKMLGVDHIAFVEVNLSDTRGHALRRFNEAVMKVPEIEQCHMIAGNYDYLLKVRTHDIAEYRRVMGEVISALPHVERTSTFVSMESVKDEMLKGERA